MQVRGLGSPNRGYSHSFTLVCCGAIPIGSSLVVGFVHLAAESLRVSSRRRLGQTLGQIRKLFRNREPPFRLQTANSTRQIRRIIFPTSAFAPSGPHEIGEFSSAFSGTIAPIRQAQPPLDLTHVFWEGTNRRPPRRLIRPLGIEGNAVVTLNVYADIEPMSKIQNMLRVAPALRGKSSRRSR